MTARNFHGPTLSRHYLTPNAQVCGSHSYGLIDVSTLHMYFNLVFSVTVYGLIVSTVLVK
jgi:hypothetical protein